MLNGAVLNRPSAFGSSIRIAQELRDVLYRMVIAPSRAGCSAAPATEEPTFTAESYAHPLERRLDLLDFNHPRLGIHSTGQHVVPLTTEEGQMLLVLLKASSAAPATPSTGDGK